MGTDWFLLQCMLKIEDDLHEIFLIWAVQYIGHCDVVSDNALSFENLESAMDGIADGINAIGDEKFHLLYNPDKQRQFEVLIGLFYKLKTAKPMMICLITKMMKVFDAMCGKKEGRKYLLLEKVSANHENFEFILQLLSENKTKYEKLRLFVDNYFRKLVEQKHFDEEEQEFEQKELKKQKKREEVQRIEEEKINKIKEEKQRIEREQIE